MAAKSDIFNVLMTNFIESVKKQSFSVSDGTQSHNYRRQSAYGLLQTALKFAPATSQENLDAKLLSAYQVLLSEIDKIASFLGYSANSGQTTQNGANMAIDEWRKCVALLEKQGVSDGENANNGFGFFG